MSNQSLQPIQQLIRQGKRAEALQILVTLLKTDRDNVDAWWLFANAATKPEQIEFALNNVLRLEPFHFEAEARLESLKAQSAAEFFNTVSPTPVDSATLSYFGTSVDNDDLPSEPDWSAIESRQIVAFNPMSSHNRPAITPLPVFSPTSVHSRSGSSAAFWLLLLVVIVVGAAVIGLVGFRDDISDAVADLDGDDHRQSVGPPPTPLNNWRVFHGPEMEIQLPTFWIGIRFDNDDLDERLNEIERQYPGLAFDIDFIRTNSGTGLSFFALDPNIPASGYTTYVIVTSEYAPTSATMDDIMAQAVSEFEPELNAHRVDDVNLDGYDAGVIASLVYIDAVAVQQSTYVIRDGEDVWTITFSTDSANYYQYQAVFDVIAKSFRTRD